MNDAVQHFITVLGSQSEVEITGRRVLEVGAGDVNGNIRKIIEQFKPSSYVGADLEAGPGVDVVCDAENLLDEFEPESFDVVISTELLEHVKRPPRVMRAMGGVLAVGGQMVITTRSHPFPYHPFPADFWRYNLAGLGHLFEGISVRPDVIVPDWMMAGVFGKGTKVGRNVSLGDGPVPGVTAVYRGSVAMKSPTTVEVKQLNGGEQIGLDVYLGEVRGEKPLVSSVGMDRAEAVRLRDQLTEAVGHAFMGERG